MYVNISICIYIYLCMYIHIYIYVLGLYVGNIGIMEKRMETTIEGYIGLYIAFTSTILFVKCVFACN